MINRPVGNNDRAATIIKVPEGIMRRALLGTAALGLMLVAGSGPAAAVDITFARFFGACEADYGTVTDVSQARGECGIITALTNKFNATNPDGIVVKPQIIEWNPYYDQLTARIASRDVPAIAVMHTAVLGDYARRRLVEPLQGGRDRRRESLCAALGHPFLAVALQYRDAEAGRTGRCQRRADGAEKCR
jgi:hypothetical protein